MPRTSWVDSQPRAKLLGQAKKCGTEKRSSLFYRSVTDEEAKALLDWLVVTYKSKFRRKNKVLSFPSNCCRQIAFKLSLIPPTPLHCLSWFGLYIFHRVERCNCSLLVKHRYLIVVCSHRRCKKKKKYEVADYTLKSSFLLLTKIYIEP